MAAEDTEVSTRYKALQCPAAKLGSTWAILDRDGARRQVEPYLSSLGQGEGGTGTATSPPFVIAGDVITFTICGHDGPGGGRGENYIALVDARKGNVLLKAEAPGSDALQDRSWDVGSFRGKEVRIEVRDGNAGSAYAWLGVGRIDAPGMSVDFRRGMPEGWDMPEAEAKVRYETLSGGVPFKRNTAVFTLIPKSGSIDLPCGFTAKRLFFLGCTIAWGEPLAKYGQIEIHYQSGPPDVVPLVYGVTLDGRYKLPSPSEKTRLHPSADPYQYYLVVVPKPSTIEKIRLAAEADGGPIPRITAVTCETTDECEHLMPPPAGELSADEAAWIETHGVKPGAAGVGSGTR